MNFEYGLKNEKKLKIWFVRLNSLFFLGSKFGSFVTRN